MSFGFFIPNIMIYKILRIDDDVTENSLECFVNTEYRIVLKNPDDNNNGYNSFIITLDRDDAIELSNELRKLVKSL